MNSLSCKDEVNTVDKIKNERVLDLKMCPKSIVRSFNMQKKVTLKKALVLEEETNRKDKSLLIVQ